MLISYIVYKKIKKHKNSKYFEEEHFIKINLDSTESVKARFFGINTFVNIQGIQIEDPLVYVGDNNHSLDYLNEIPFLVQTQLPIAKKNYSYQDNRNRKIVSYTSMSQKEKLEFLLWVSRKCTGDIYNKEFINLYVEGIRYYFFNNGMNDEHVLLRIISIYNEYKHLDKKIKNYLEETILYISIQLEYFTERKELSRFITNELNIDRHDIFRYKLMLEYVIYNGENVDDFYLLFLYGIIYKDLYKYLNHKNKKFLLKLFEDEFKEVPKEFLVKEKVLNYKNYKINTFVYEFSNQFEEKISKFVDRIIVDLKVFLFVSKGKSFEEAFHFLPEKYKRKYNNPYFDIILDNIKGKSGIYMLKDVISNVPFFSMIDDKMSSKESKQLNQLILDSQWSIEPDIRITNRNYKLSSLICLYKQNGSLATLDIQSEIKNQVIIDTLFNMINVELNPSKRKIIMSFFEENFAKTKDSLERVKRRLSLIEAGYPVDLNNISKIKFNKDEVFLINDFLVNNYRDFLFSENKKNKFIELISTEAE